jgi:hypothetical protein
VRFGMRDVDLGILGIEELNFRHFRHLIRSRQ